MKVILFGATGLVGAGALREALAAPEVESVLSIGRRASGVLHPRLRELVLPDLDHPAEVVDQLAGYDAAIWAIGISSVGLSEDAYARVTEGLTLEWARLLLRLNPDLSFCYCSAAGAGGRATWARVRQRVEGALRAMPFRHVGVVRPGFIRPAPGTSSQVKAYRIGARILKPFFPVFLRTVPSLFTTSERLGRAMLRIVLGRADRFILESRDINRLGA